MKLFDYECVNGHIQEEMFNDSEPPPDELECNSCKNAGRFQLATRIKMYANPGVNLPNNPGTYNRG